MDERLEKIETELQIIKRRNERVELDKAWETSALRRSLVAVFTYLPIAIYMWAIGVNKPWLNAIIPTLGFLISILSLPWIKKTWIEKRNS